MTGALPQAAVPPAPAAAAALARYWIGLDAGSTTVKAVVVEAATGAVAWREYRRHRTRQAEMALEFLRRIERELSLDFSATRLCLTGSGGAALEAAGGRYVQEVRAVAAAARALHPGARTILELGGQDAKLLVFEPDGEGGTRTFASMNDKCAGGTGAVIDKISAKLGLDNQRLIQLPYDGVSLHPIAGKCGVFAESDINSLQKQGIAAEELMASLFDAIVLQNLTVLTRGHLLPPRVLLLGGPHASLPALRQAWRSHLSRIWRERELALPEGVPLADLVLAPEHAATYGAYGAVLAGWEEPEAVPAYQGAVALEHALAGRQHSRPQAIPGLAGEPEPLRQFRRRYRAPEWSAPEIFPGDLPAWIGLDAGSTSTKAVLLDREGQLLRSAYRLSAGNPLQDAQALLAELESSAAQAGARLRVLGLAVTGYAKDLLAPALGADLALPETVAHAASALAVARQVEVILDVGGQDIKLMVLREGRVRDFRLNSQCSAGNGFFLQATAESFGVPLGQYAETAFQAKAMPEFGYGCAVFLQSDIANFQRQGWEAAEILAGLAAVLPKNIFFYVAGIANPAQLGARFLLQGGAQKNLAVVKAEVDFLQARYSGPRPLEISLHPHCGEAGAIGAALEARRASLSAAARRASLSAAAHRTSFREAGAAQNDARGTDVDAALPSRFIGFAALARLRATSRRDESTRCRFCRNACLRTFVTLEKTAEPPPADFQLAQPTSPGKPPIPAQPPDRPEAKPPAEPAMLRRLILASCEKGAAEDVETMRRLQFGTDAVQRANPNLAAWAADAAWRPPRQQPETPRRKRLGRLGGLRGSDAAGRLRAEYRLGIPRVLDFYLYAPLFSGYFLGLGLRAQNLVYSDFTSPELYRAGSSRGAIDPCFPSKVALAHVEALLRRRAPRPLDAIFFPLFDVLDSPVRARAHNGCPAAAVTPEVVRAALAEALDPAAGGVDYVQPLLDLSDRKRFARQMFAAWRERLRLTPAENERACEWGFAHYQAFRAEMEWRAGRVLERLEREQRIGLVLLGRPYHHDPGLNHAIPEDLQKLGYPILSQNALPRDPAMLERLFGHEIAAGLIRDAMDLGDIWKNSTAAATNDKLWAAKFAARHPWLVGLELSSFKCGHDAPVSSLLESLFEAAGKPFFYFRDLDENKAAGSIRLRIETMDYFLRRYREELLAAERPCAAAGLLDAEDAWPEAGALHGDEASTGATCHA